MVDEYSDNGLVRPSSVLQCINKDDTIILLKYLLYLQYKQKNKQKHNNADALADTLLDEAYSAFISFVHDITPNGWYFGKVLVIKEEKRMVPFKK
jgi:hypothetical protein